jgi:tRNA(Ser,Leu) C12 N-acetylase TAN1
MSEWNVVATVREDRYREALRALKRFGDVQRTNFFNVVALRVADIAAFLEEFRAALKADPKLGECFGHLVPATDTFAYQSREEFEANTRRIVSTYAPAIAGQRFHVRMHRRGFHETLSSQEEERMQDRFLVDLLARAGQEAAIDFDDPDAIITIETVGGRAGMALWNRAALERYPFLHLD